MTRISRLVRKSPYVFYAAGVILLLFGIGLPLRDLSQLGYSTSIPMDNSAYKTAITELVMRVASDALYMFANGVVIQVLIAIHDRLATPKSKSAE